MHLLKLSVVILTSIFSMVWFVPSSAQACEEGPTSALVPDDAGGAIRIDPIDACIQVTCGPPPECTILNATPHFIRHPSTASAPSSTGGAGCFAVARNDNGYHLLFTSESGYRRWESTDGGITWNDLGVVTGFDAAPWIKLTADGLPHVQCPDPHFIGTSGKMTMFFSGVRKPSMGGSWAVGRATSTDNGASWTVDSAPLVVANETHYPYMPSALHISDGGHLLAYSWVCKNTLIEAPTNDVLYSANGVDTWVPRAVPGVPTGSCNRWDDGSVNRPRLVRDPVDPTTVHMFFSAYEWNGVDKPTRKCGRIGRAFSTDNGFTWTKNTRPVFEPAVGGPNWDFHQVLKPSLVVEPCESDPSKSVLRLFYEGAGDPFIPGSLAGLGIADAPWPFGSGQCTSAEIALQEEPAPEEDESIAKLTSVPNPTRGTTSIEVDLSRARVAGEAELTIIDVTGRLVRHLWTGSSLTAPQTIDWDGRESGGARVAPGRYLARMRIGDTTAGTHWITMTR